MQVRSQANFFNKYSQPRSPWVSHLGSQPTVDQKTVFLIQSWESADVEGLLYTSIHAALYNGFKHPQILVSVEEGGLGTKSCRYQRMTVKFGRMKSYMWIFDCMEVNDHKPHIVQGSTAVNRVMKKLLSAIFLITRWSLM